jgi:hypothetical protein
MTSTTRRAEVDERATPRPSFFVSSEFRVSGSDAANEAEQAALAAAPNRGSPVMRRRAEERALTAARSKLKLDALVSMVRSELGVSGARTIDDVARIRAEKEPRTAIGAAKLTGRRRSSDGELFDITAGIACVSVASLVRRVYAHLVGAPIEWRNGKKSKSEHAHLRTFEEFARREDRRLISQREYRALLKSDQSHVEHAAG